MTQEHAQHIIRSTYGHKAVAIGHSVTPSGAVVIYWIFRGESENDCREHVTV